MVAIGLAIPLPAMSGAEPWIGSYIPLPVSFIEADGSMPIEPVIMDASSDRISPNRLPVTITSNWPGLRTSCIAQLSTYISEYSTSGYSSLMRCMVSRQTRLVSSTFALSTEQTFLFRFIAISNARRPMRSTS